MEFLIVAHVWVGGTRAAFFGGAPTSLAQKIAAVKRRGWSESMGRVSALQGKNSCSKLVGATGFEPATSTSRTSRSSQTEPRPAPFRNSLPQRREGRKENLTCIIRKGIKGFYFASSITFSIPIFPSLSNALTTMV